VLLLLLLCVDHLRQLTLCPSALLVKGSLHLYQPDSHCATTDSGSMRATTEGAAFSRFTVALTASLALAAAPWSTRAASASQAVTSAAPPVQLPPFTIGKIFFCVPKD